MKDSITLSFSRFRGPGKKGKRGGLLTHKSQLTTQDTREPWAEIDEEEVGKVRANKG